MVDKFKQLEQKIKGEIHVDELTKNLFAVDASVYREQPLAVAYPKDTKDIQTLVRFSQKNKTALIPRAAGTSLAGQCVGNGIVVDTSRFLTQIINIDTEKNTGTVQPGVIRDDLNRSLKQYGLFFSPTTSTSNRSMMGGMLGNNSSGTTSIKYGVTRDKVLEVHTVLSDGSKVIFGEISKKEFFDKTREESLEGKIYKGIYSKLSNENIRTELLKGLPKESIHRRNTGYAADELLKNEVFSDLPDKFNMCKLLAGSEGTLAFTTQITVKLDELPPEQSAMVAVHFNAIEDCLRAVVPVMEHDLFTCEMMDKTILDRTKSSLKFRNYRFFIQKDPKGLLLLELRAKNKNQLETQIEALLATIKDETKSYAQPVLRDDEPKMAIELRKAGLGLLGNIPGDRKAVACIEDTAVALPDLADYIIEFTELTKAYDQELVYYAHAGAGELHLRPMLNLKKSEDVKQFRRITADIAALVKKYNGSLSGEHGDGRVRAEFIQDIVGKKNLKLFEEIKALFDPENILNPGKIVHPVKMDTALRYEPDRKEPKIPTLLDFSDSQGILRAAENCNGTGECRKSVEAGGTMCPSYRATKNEKDSTRGRANALREFLTHSDKPNKFDHEELKDVLDLCISCKGCKNECPSNVDMALYKAEFTHQYQKEHGKPLRSKVFARNHKFNQMGAKVPGITNAVFKNNFTSGIIKSIMGVAQERNLPLISKKSLRKCIEAGELKLKPAKKKIKSVYLFIDEFTEHLDTQIGKDAINLLVNLGYGVKITDHEESGRSHISKGFLDEAKPLADKNVSIFSQLITEETPLIGIEPSSILTFRDEYLRMADQKEKAKNLADKVFLIDEFLATEIEQGNIKAEHFTKEEKTVKIHGHCHQKAMSNLKNTFDILNLPENYKVTIIPSGCCGMAGSFGYEKEHYEISMQIGEHSLLPAVRKSSDETIISANGTSCRHQIKDGAKREALHPVSILWQALKSD